MNAGTPVAETERVDQVLFAETLAAALGRGTAVVLRVQGVSMLPWLREGAPVRIRPLAGRRLRRGDIALFWRAPGQPIVHRVVRPRPAEGIYECLGDAEHGQPERVAAAAVIGAMELPEIKRGAWLLLHPVRRWINHFCRRRGVRLRHG